jgi:hypothetical protein
MKIKDHDDTQLYRKKLEELTKNSSIIFYI